MSIQIDIQIDAEGNFIVGKEIIKKVIEWWNIPGTQKVFLSYHEYEKKNGVLDGKTLWQIKRNTIRGKIAEICEHFRLGLPIIWEDILRSDIKGDGGIDVVFNGKNIDVKSRDGFTYGFLISNKKFNPDLNIYFSGYTVLEPYYTADINEDLENMKYQYTGIVHTSHLVEMRHTIKMLVKFRNMIEVPSHCFEMNRNKCPV